MKEMMFITPENREPLHTTHGTRKVTQPHMPHETRGGVWGDQSLGPSRQPSGVHPELYREGLGGSGSWASLACSTVPAHCQLPVTVTAAAVACGHKTQAGKDRQKQKEEGTNRLGR